MLQEIINFVAINANLGTAGQPTHEQLTAVKEAGYEVVINLLPSSSPNALADEPAVVSSLGMEYIHIPVIWDQPTLSDLEQFFQVMQQNQNRKVFVHCAMNMRVSAFVFLYRVKTQGTAPEEARATMLKIWEPNPTWQSFIENCLRS